ncbi:hypothetical protein I552_9391 [Mycobacterium xenopi 3993]|nr:hypothetical protein I552_9391 [Mycobacterium xenopi 3993]
MASCCYWCGHGKCDDYKSVAAAVGVSLHRTQLLRTVLAPRPATTAAML